MKMNDYQALAMRTAKTEDEPIVGNLVHASLGLITEVGEFVSEVKRMARYGKPMSEEMKLHMFEELGDVMWYVALGAEALGVKMEAMAEHNIDKLRKRFPDQFSNELAEARLDKGGVSHLES